MSRYRAIAPSRRRNGRWEFWARLLNYRPQIRASVSGKRGNPFSAILSAIEDGMYTPSVKDRMAELEPKTAQLESTLAGSADPPKLRLHPAISEVHTRKVEKHGAALEAPATQAEARLVIRGMVERIALTPVENGRRAEPSRDLAAILAACEAAKGKKITPRERVRGASTVAGCGRPKPSLLADRGPLDHTDAAKATRFMGMECGSSI